MNRRINRDPRELTDRVSLWALVAFFLVLAFAPLFAHATIAEGTPRFRWEQTVPNGGTVAQFKLFCQASGAPTPSAPFKTFAGDVREYQSTRGELVGTYTCWLDVVGTDGGFSGSNRITITVPVQPLTWPRPTLQAQ